MGVRVISRGPPEVRNSSVAVKKRGCLCLSGPLGGATEQLPGQKTSGDSHKRTHLFICGLHNRMNVVDEHLSSKLQSFKNAENCSSSLFESSFLEADGRECVSPAETSCSPK